LAKGEFWGRNYGHCWIFIKLFLFGGKSGKLFSGKKGTFLKPGFLNKFPLKGISGSTFFGLGGLSRENLKTPG